MPYKKITAITMLTLTGFSVIAEENFSIDGCAINPPPGWNEKNTRWDGPCLYGHAEGLGVLKEYAGNRVKRFFFGRLKMGEVYFGVMEDGDFKAGYFRKGHALKPDHDLYIAAYLQAIDAADQVAEKFEMAGNKASAKFYRDKSIELSSHMPE